MELLELAQGHAQSELASREVLGTRLGGLITVAAALLALSVAGAREAAETPLDPTARTLFSVAFVGAVAALVGVILIALRSLGPDLRAVPSPKLLRHYGERGTAMSEVRADAYKLNVAVLCQLGPANGRRARGVRLALMALIGALLLAAVAATTVYIGSR
jgi:hypothetical protein